MKLQLHWQILIALALAVVAGWITQTVSTSLATTLINIYDFVGTLFLNALKMLIVPLIFASIINGMSGIGASGALGRLGSKALIYYAATSFLAIMTGLVLVNMIAPGTIDGQPANQVIALDTSTDISSVESKIEGKGGSDIVEVFLRMVPPNIVQAAANGQMLGLIFFSLLFGYFITRIKEPLAQQQKDFWNGIFQTMMGITDLVMKFAPIGVFALVAEVIANLDPSEYQQLAEILGKFVITVLLALAIHAFVTMPAILKFIARVKPTRHIQAMSPAMITAFSTASSSATLPITMDCVEKRAGVSNETTSFVLPLGATVNMDGTALYECVAAMFIAQVYGLELTLATQFTIVTIALLTSIGVAGIPSASLVAITIILGSIGLPLEAIGLILVVDRVLDMFRTSVNVFGDSCGAVVIARTEGEQDILTGNAKA